MLHRLYLRCKFSVTVVCAWLTMLMIVARLIGRARWLERLRSYGLLCAAGAVRCKSWLVAWVIEQTKPAFLCSALEPFRWLTVRLTDGLTRWLFGNLCL